MNAVTLKSHKQFTPSALRPGDPATGGLRQRAVDLHDVLGHVHELVHEALAVHLGEDPALVVVAQRAAHGLVVHVRLVLVQPPQPRHRLGVHQLEHALLAVGPLDVARAVLAVLQQLQQELPQVGGGALARLALDAGRGRRVAAGALLGLELVVVVVALVVAEVEHGVGQLVVRQRRRGRGEVVPAAAAVAVAVALALRRAHCNNTSTTLDNTISRNIMTGLTDITPVTEADKIGSFVNICQRDLPKTMVEVLR